LSSTCACTAHGSKAAANKARDARRLRSECI
jgi:hypothetical protein